MLVSLLIQAPAQAQRGDQVILLRNVMLIEPADTNADLLPVNILIKDGKLDIVSKDAIPREEADITYDGASGVILGQLSPGEPASFMILRGDPRLDVDILLDTKTSATFAIRKSTIVKNNFISVTE